MEMFLLIFSTYFLPLVFSYGGIQLKNQATGKCLDSNRQGLIYAIPCNHGDHQEWVQGKDHTLMNLATQRCLDANEEHVYANSCHGESHQKWGTSTVHLRNEATEMCLEGNEYSNEVKVVHCEDEKNQMWGEYKEGEEKPNFLKDEL